MHLDTEQYHPLSTFIMDVYVLNNRRRVCVLKIKSLCEVNFWLASVVFQSVSFGQKLL